jgi:formate dehydrogenase major subunit
VGIVGAGPAGLAAAHDLALAGHAVTVYEAAPGPGGMALLGVPRFRLSEEAIRRDVARIRDLGVEFRFGVRVGSDVGLDQLRELHHALLIAAGAMRPNRPDLPDIHLSGVVQALDFLAEANLGGTPACGRRVAVIGGGYTAMDAARTAVRLGARSVTVLYRRTRAESEVHEEELEETLREGVEIQYLVSPVRVLDDGIGRAAGIEFVRNRLGENDSSGRPRPVAIEGTECVVPADTVILALGQSPDPRAIDARLGTVRPSGDRALCETEVPGLFVAGDFVTGPSTIIEAAADGREAAVAIHRYLHETSAPADPCPGIREVEIELRENGDRSTRATGGRGLRLDVEPEETLSRAEAMAEGLRCLHCGLPPRVTFELCTACRACEIVCPVDCIRRVTLDESGAIRPSERSRDVAVYDIDLEQCIRCGLCFGACPTGAIVVEGFSWPSNPHE